MKKTLIALIIIAVICGGIGLFLHFTNKTPELVVDNSKINEFVDSVKLVYNKASEKRNDVDASASMNEDNFVFSSYAEPDDFENLGLSDTSIKYCIRYNSSGSIVDYRVSNGTYSYVSSNVSGVDSIVASNVKNDTTNVEIDCITPEMREQAERDSFENEVKFVYKAAQTSFITDAINAAGANGYVYSSGTNCKNLDITSTTNLKYYVKVNNNGNVTELIVTNGKYNFNMKSDNINIKDIVVNVSEPSVEIPSC